MINQAEHDIEHWIFGQSVPISSLSSVCLSTSVAVYLNLFLLNINLFVCPFFSASSALLLQFEYLMSALPLVTMHYFSALLRAHWLLSLPLTLPGLRPEADTVSHTAVSHPLLCSISFFILPPDISVYTVINCTVSCLSDNPTFNFSLILEAEVPGAAELCIIIQTKCKKHNLVKCNEL